MEERIRFFKEKEVSVFVFEWFYEAILEICHAFLALEGFKTVSHECAIEFLRNNAILSDSQIEFLHRMRRIKHGIKYYGFVVSFSQKIH